jgi:ABC-type glycerol-3-phosphate transport system substrate-binding protein
MIPGFFSGKYAMLIGIGAWARQQLVENAPADFSWGVLPPLQAQTQNTGISTQTLSIPKKSKQQAAAMHFIEFMLNTQNMAQLAQSDWMIPTRKSCLSMPQFQTSHDGWEVVTGAGPPVRGWARPAMSSGKIAWPIRCCRNFLPIVSRLKQRRNASNGKAILCFRVIKCGTRHGEGSARSRRRRIHGVGSG